jgi:signal-transduction protein with cAMP-binding, CBS, and nucleotidyltransferase domain
MRPKLSSDLQNDTISVMLEGLRSSGIFFTDWNKLQLDHIRDHFRFLTFQMKQQLTRRNEPVDFLGIILKGSANVIMDHKSQSVLGVGDVIGAMSLYRMQGYFNTTRIIYYNYTN